MWQVPIPLAVIYFIYTMDIVRGIQALLHLRRTEEPHSTILWSRAAVTVAVMLNVVIGACIGWLGEYSTFSHRMIALLVMLPLTAGGIAYALDCHGEVVKVTRRGSIVKMSLVLIGITMATLLAYA